jgi:hypothetical protein
MEKPAFCLLVATARSSDFERHDVDGVAVGPQHEKPDRQHPVTRSVQDASDKDSIGVSRRRKMPS